MLITSNDADMLSKIGSDLLVSLFSLLCSLRLPLYANDKYTVFMDKCMDSFIKSLR